MSADAAVFRALSNSTRRAILEELTDHREQTLYELQVRLTINHDVDMTRQGVSKHLDVLVEPGLITSRRRGRQKVMAFGGVDQVQAAAAWLNRLTDDHTDTDQSA